MNPGSEANPGFLFDAESDVPSEETPKAEAWAFEVGENKPRLRIAPR